MIVARAAGTPRDLLAGPWSLDWVKSHLVAASAFEPVPSIEQRAQWDALPSAVRAAYVRAGEAALPGPWESLPASVLLEFVRNGNRSRYETLRRHRRERLQALTLAELFDHQGRFLDAIADGIWLTCEETYWGVPSALILQKAGRGLPDVTEPVIDLQAGETAAQLAWTYALLGARLDRVSPLIRPRIVLEIERRVLTPFLERDDFWWMGSDPRRELNNWTPWVISNVLASALLLETNADRRAAIVYKSLRLLDRYLNEHPEDAGCDEGPGYWNHAAAALFDALELLHRATAGALDVFREPLIREAGRYIDRMHIAGDWFVNFGDGSAQAAPDGPLIFRFGERIGDAPTKAFGAWLAQRAAAGGRPWQGSLTRLLPALLAYDRIMAADAQPALVREHWFPAQQILVAREREGSTRGLFLAAKGGSNRVSHNHNDIGSFVVAADGQPALIDVGVETYTAKTFGHHRFELWTMQSAYHNLPTINGAMQAAGREFAAREVSCRTSPRGAEFALDLAGAYPRGTATRWMRRFRFVRGKEIEIADTFALPRAENRLEFNFMTACEVRALAPGRLLLAGGGAAPGNAAGVTLAYDAARLRLAVDEIHTDDARLRPVWGDTIRRLRLIAERVPREGEFVFRIESADGKTKGVAP